MEELRLNGLCGKGNCAAAEDKVPRAREDETELVGGTSCDLVAAFFADVGRSDRLTRGEEETLALEVSERRGRILGLLRSRPALVADALQGAGRGVVRPEDDFREREALAVLVRARERLRQMRPTQRGHKALRKFVCGLEREIAAYRIRRDRMLTANVRLVMTLARRYRHPRLSYLDLVQEGVLGLVRAIEKYEPTRGIKFSTYAVWWIWQQISRAADCQGAVIRTPVHWNQLRRKMSRSARQGEEGIDPDTMAEEFGVAAGRLRVMAQSFQCLSLMAPLGDDGRTAGDVLDAGPAGDPEATMLAADLSRRLTMAVGQLPDREAQILRLRFGLSGRDEHTLEEIGQRFGVSRERIRQIEARALRQMLEICKARGLSEILH